MTQTSALAVETQSQYLVSRIISKVVELPGELFEKISRDLEDSFGKDFIDRMLVAMKLTSSISFRSSNKESVENLGKQLEIKTTGVFGEELVDKLGAGFCYLSALDVSVRCSALKLLLAYPSLGEFLSRFAESVSTDFIVIVDKGGKVGHVSTDLSPSKGRLVLFYFHCPKCQVTKNIPYFSSDFLQSHSECSSSRSPVVCGTSDDLLMYLRVGGLFDSFRSKSSGKKSLPSRSRSKALTDSKNHEDTQVLGFEKSIKGDGATPDMTRDLFSVPKPTEIERMADHMQNHKTGDIFPYIAVVGNEDESKESRLSRLRAYKSPYGKEAKPELRINGIVLDEIEGTIQVQHLKEYVNKEQLTKQESKQNKKFRPLVESSFTKPYLQMSRITGEFVPLMSSTADYTDLHFTLEDGRLLDNQTIVQSSKLPTNQNGVFELSCDYCLNVKDLSQLSIKYFLARPIMREGFQWGSISLNIRLAEADTPYLIPKVEAMAIVRAPYTTLEEYQKDPDHADIVFTAGQITKLREMYQTGDIADVDEPKKERSKISSYSKSTLRGQIKGEAGPDFLENQDGWGHLKGMRKPLLQEGEASVSAPSDDSKDAEEVSLDLKFTKEQYQRQQEELRKQYRAPMSDNTEEISDSELQRSSSPVNRPSPNSKASSELRPALKKITRFSIDSQLEAPNTEDVYHFN
ncbi:movement protein [Grapevine associated cogu-like virus 4]|uniref:Movement protein n=2 Tax=Phenuiviridae TaxID=1980418 RepID=A0A7D7ITY2_9VIRU|nr:movement protein [Grapevine associated cogu-like virus 4]QMP81964.1 movement protein [Grapevine associated cogu-like virus 4]QXN75421.1 MAG: hypothetical protein [Grapevine-associated phenui-like virus 1]